MIGAVFGRRSAPGRLRAVVPRATAQLARCIGPASKPEATRHAGRGVGRPGSVWKPHGGRGWLARATLTPVWPKACRWDCGCAVLPNAEGCDYASERSGGSPPPLQTLRRENTLGCLESRTAGRSGLGYLRSQVAVQSPMGEHGRLAARPYLVLLRTTAMEWRRA